MCLPPATSSLIAVALPLLTLCHRLPFCLSCASSPAGCCVTSTHTAPSDLLASPPLIATLSLIAPWPPVPLVWLVVALPLLMLLPPICQHLQLSLHHYLLSHHSLLCLLSGWLLRCLRRSSSWCVPASQHATSTSHLSFTYCLLWLVLALLLLVPPLTPILLTGNHLSTH
jgi:hypothetical protein